MVQGAGSQEVVRLVERRWLRWRYRRARRKAVAMMSEWSKLDYPGYVTPRLLQAQAKALRLRKQLQDMEH